MNFIPPVDAYVAHAGGFCIFFSLFFSLIPLLLWVGMVEKGKKAPS